MTAAEFETSLQDKNDLRRASGLPLYDVERELARFHTDQQAAAYAAFVAAHLKPHTTVQWASVLVLTLAENGAKARARVGSNSGGPRTSVMAWRTSRQSDPSPFSIGTPLGPRIRADAPSSVSDAI